MTEAVDRRIVLGYASRIPWDTYIGVGRAKSGETVFVDAADVKAIRRYAVESPSALTELLATDEDARRYPQALLKVLMNITDVRILQYALTLVEDFLAADPTSRAKYFTKPVAGGGGAAAGSGVGSDKVFVTPFLQLIGTSGASIMSLDANPYVLEHAAICAAQLISVDCSDTHATPALLAWIMTHVKKYGSADPKQVKVTEVAVTALRSLLRHDFLQKVFVEEGGVEALTVMLNARNTQLLYDVVFCLWSVSLNAAYVPMLESANTVHAVCRLARVTMPLKVLRVSLALLANAAKYSTNTETLADICESHVPETVETLATQEPKLTDPELLEDLATLREAIRSNKRRLTSMERYEKDVGAKRFEWSTVHSSDFWKENALNFEQDGFRIIAAIRDMLREPAALDETTIAVALFDLGEFAVNHPQGRAILQSLDVRPLVLGMLKREEDEIRQQALLATSKMLVTRWEYVNAGSSTPK